LKLVDPVGRRRKQYKYGHTVRFPQEGVAKLFTDSGTGFQEFLFTLCILGGNFQASRVAAPDRHGAQLLELQQSK
jgi:hypothetical protein